MTSIILRTLLAASLLSLANAAAQSSHVDVYTSTQLAASATKPLSSNGQDILERYPNHYTMLITRHGDGQSELHEHLADVFFVVQGEAQLWSGGAMQDDKVSAPGERRGTGLTGATSVTLKRGDVVHIPANLPHQLRMAKGMTFTYFVVKVDESASPHPAPQASR